MHFSTVVVALILCAAIHCSAIPQQPENGSKVSHGGHWSAHVKTWKPSTEMSRECPYYQAGYDFDGRPGLLIFQKFRRNLFSFEDTITS